VPIDVEPFDNVGGPLDGFRAAVQDRFDRCGYECLAVTEDIAGDDADPSACIVVTISYDPEPKPKEAAEEDRLLERGTEVEAQITCIKAFDNTDRTLDALRAAVKDRLSQCDNECLTVKEDITGDDTDPSACVVDDISYTPEPLAGDGSDRWLTYDTEVSAQVTCPGTAEAASNATAQV
jgi:hypothetical protein